MHRKNNESNLNAYREEELFCKNNIDPKGMLKDDPKKIINSAVLIRVYLADTNAVHDGLKHLDHLLQMELKNREDQGLDKNKILRTVLDRELEKLAFEKQGKATDYLRSSVFKSAIAGKVILKDPGAGFIHGEFTHAIQCLLVGWGIEKDHFLDKPLVEILQTVASLQISASDTIFSQWWDSVFDVLVNDAKETNNKFSCPDLLHQYILNSNELPFLNRFCQERNEKRQYDTDSPPRFGDSDRDQAKMWFEQRRVVRAKKVIDKKDFPKTEYDMDRSDIDSYLLLPKKKS